MIYPYLCQKCSHRFEVEARVSDPPPEKCPLPDCDGAVKRQIGTGTAHILLGGGWASTGYGGTK